MLPLWGARLDVTNRWMPMPQVPKRPRTETPRAAARPVVNLVGAAAAQRHPDPISTDSEPARHWLDATTREVREEAVAQALAVIGRIEGDHRALANGDTRDRNFHVAELLREVALAIRREVADPTTRSTLEVVSRADEAQELSAYVLEVSAQYEGLSHPGVAEALSSVAGDIRKGTEGIGKLRLASDVTTPPDVLADLMEDPDPDVRWWAAQNPETPGAALSTALGMETQGMVLAALLSNGQLPIERAGAFVSHPIREVGAAARSRLGL